MVDRKKNALKNGCETFNPSRQSKVSCQKIREAVAHCGSGIHLIDPTTGVNLPTGLKSSDFVVLASSDYHQICNTASHLDQAQGKIPAVIYLPKYDEVAELLGLRLGVYDVVHHKMSTRVIKERITAAQSLHIHGTGPLPSRMVEESAVASPHIDVDIQNQHLLVEGRKISLTPAETKIVEFLWNSRDSLISREDLAKAVDPNMPKTKSRVIDSHIKRIRTKLLDAGISKHLITSVYGGGYKMVSEQRLGPS
ncbi:DNA-binding response regulator, OmpR family, contains REC and winged-helix (wHTH) domain [Roseovarius litoreus]|uniref:DNA-binding response regulator, OmpR family, contains REC and winged-helix (WHTH) domain n=1 Tax=Roseovarius litoreus TaxID=1155722 RepID=A0A1M7L088_9RHOB|nr:winged helix-turn-helix domain-containing protein [Roseovarius litoreus]SHM70751.1 DNA-binding response regulator, OmpR family, contains REC and winged-helix (wHTH) domain [Roseovarius litoreus]